MEHDLYIHYSNFIFQIHQFKTSKHMTYSLYSIEFITCLVC